MTAKSKYTSMAASAACAILIVWLCFPAPAAAIDPAFEKGWREDSLLSTVEYFNSRTRKTIRVAENDPCYRYDMSREYEKQVAACTKDISEEEFNRHSMGFGVSDRYYNRGNAYYEMGADDKAMADYNKAIELSPALFYAYSNRGLIYYRKGEYDRAIADYTKALTAEDGVFTTRPLINRGDAYFMKGDYKRAIADYTKAIKLAPAAFLDNMYYNAHVYRGNRATARAEYRKAISGVYYKRGLAYRRTGQLEKAAADQRTAIGIMRNGIQLPGLDSGEE